MMKTKHPLFKIPASGAIAPIIGFALLANAFDSANADEAGDLAKAAQNPVASMISVPLDTSIDFGADNGTAVISNFQPVVPISLNEDWNLINRPILPIVYLEGAVAGLPSIPEAADLKLKDSKFGIGDLNYSAFLSPAKAGDIIWGAGPSVTFPTASDDLLGAGKWSLGPTVVLLAQPKPWSLGVLARNIWSVGGESDRAQVNQFLVQPFVNYNLSDGWFLTFDPIMTANWKAKEKWTVPLGAGVGRIFKIGEQPVNMRLRGYYNTVKPKGAPDWSLQFAIQLLFPR